MGWWPGSRRRTPAPVSTAPPTTAREGPTVPEVRVDRSPEGRLSAATARVATWSLRLLLIVAGLTVLGYVVGKVWVVVLPAFLGLVLASVLWPLTRLFRRAMPDAAASLLTIFVTLMALSGLGAVLVPMVSGQFDELVDAVVAGLEDLKDLVAQPPFNLGEQEISNLFDSALSQLQEHTQTIGGGLLTGVSAVGGVLLNTVLAVVLAFFFLKDGPKFLPWVSGWVGSQAAPHVAELSRRAWDTLSGFIRAQAVVGLVDAVGIGIGLAVLGVPLALPLAVLVFFGAFIPIVGAFVAGALAALVALVFNGVASALIVVALILVVQQVEGNVLQPILMGRTLQLHAALVILAVTVGSALAGIAGAFLAVPVFAVATTMLRYARAQVVGEGGGTTAAQPAGPHQAGA
ncbi:MAG TPA: AI-2E family transporter [Nocardioidaceae bacterium]